MNLTYGSLFSGIEAASVAWEPLGFKPAWFSEIEPFPCEVLAERWPSVKNLGDMTKLATFIELGGAEAPDVIVGGSPCQAFSVAGSRASLGDARGQLTLKYVETVNATDRVRAEEGKPPCIVVWENVPGVLSTPDNAFGCFLGALSGGAAELEPPRDAKGKRLTWPKSGVVFGPQRAIAWRVIDAQYFGVAQRRRRVFLIASARQDFHPAQVLFEFNGMRRDTPPSRETGKKITGFTPSSFGGYNEGVGTLKASGGDLGGGSETLVAFDQQCFGGRGEAGVLSSVKARDWKGPTDLVVGALDSQCGFEKASHQSITAGHLLAAPYDTTQITSPENRSNPDPSSPWHTLNSKAHPPLVIAFDARQEPVNSTEVFGALSAGHPQSAAVAYGIPGNWIGRKPENGGNAVEPPFEIAPCLIGTDQHGVAYSFDSLSSNSMKSSNPLSGCRAVDLAKTIDTSDQNPSKNQGGICVAYSYAVRRLMPIECERLQGFPDNYTNITMKGKPALDGPRYKALGNSMAVPCMAFIGERILLSLHKPWTTGDL